MNISHARLGKVFFTPYLYAESVHNRAISLPSVNCPGHLACRLSAMHCAMKLPSVNPLACVDCDAVECDAIMQLMHARCQFIV
jgi:hypothetical protein